MQRKLTKNTRGPNSDEKKFQGWLKERNCCVSGDYGVEVHHCVGSTGKHNKVLIGHWFCLPLSTEIHREYHAGTKSWREKYATQSFFWSYLVADYQEETGCIVPADVVGAVMDLRK